MKLDSIKDPRIELARDLTSGAGRKKHRKILLFGMEQIQWAIGAGLIVEFVLSKDPVNLPTHISAFTTSEGIKKK